MILRIGTFQHEWLEKPDNQEKSGGENSFSTPTTRYLSEANHSYIRQV